MKTRIKIISTAFLFIFVMTSFLYAQNQKESTKERYGLEPVELIKKIKMKILKSEPATIECDHYSVVIKCQFTCCYCGTLLEAIGGYGNASNPKGDCPSCGSDISGCN